LFSSCPSHFNPLHRNRFIETVQSDGWLNPFISRPWEKSLDFFIAGVKNDYCEFLKQISIKPVPRAYENNRHF